MRRPRLAWNGFFMAAGLALFPAVEVLTYNAWADGDRRSFLAGLGFSVAVAAVLWFLVHTQLRRWAQAALIVPWFAAASVLLPNAVVHAARLSNPVTQTGIASVTETFGPGPSSASPAAADSNAIGVPADDWQQRWIVTLAPGASATVENGYLRLHDPVGVPGTVDLHLPDRPAWDDRDLRFYLPRGLTDLTYDEFVEFDASTLPERSFQMLLSTGDFALEVSRYGLDLSYLNAEKVLASAKVDAPEIAQGQPQRYRLERSNGVLRLRVNGESVWVNPDRGPWRTVRFGEGISDPLHGGTILLDNVHYERHFLNATAS